MHLHERFGGVVPEIASRAHVERILPVIDEALRKAGLKLGGSRRRGRGQHAGPGRFAARRAHGGQGALRWRAACRWWPSIICRPTSMPAGMASGRDVFPCVGLVVSGGHSNLYRCAGPTDFTPLGWHDRRCGRRSVRQSRQPARPAVSGRPVDRTGGPQRQSSEIPLPTAAVGRPRAARLQLQRTQNGGTLSDRRPPGKTESRQLAPSNPQEVADIAATFQEAVIDCLVGKAELALEKTGYGVLCVGGGVAANGRFRTRLEASAAAARLRALRAAAFAYAPITP